ncbi:uncharacterized protein [Heptranchias perlo]|uniref:uncharacterized protein n=1 Tax=Heptranchias perlo TaxID=212740 RepID=UPI003559A9E3
MMNHIPFIIHFVGVSFSIIPVQCFDTSMPSEVLSITSESENFNRSSPGGNDVSALTNSPISNAGVFASYSSSDQTVFSTIAPTEKLQSNTTANFTQPGIPARSSTPSILRLTPSLPPFHQSLPTITPSPEHSAKPTKESTPDKEKRNVPKPGALVAVITIVVIIVFIVIIVVLIIFNRRGKSASYYTETSHELGVPMNEVCAETPNT